MSISTNYCLLSEFILKSLTAQLPTGFRLVKQSIFHVIVHGVQGETARSEVKCRKLTCTEERDVNRLEPLLVCYMLRLSTNKSGQRGKKRRLIQVTES